MKKILVALVIIFLAGLFIYPMFKTGNIVKADVFEGVITNAEIASGVYSGTGVYDKSCNMIGNGLSQCDAGIQTEKGLLNFNYKHNMDLQPCISEGDNLQVEVLEGGKAIVTRK